MEDERTQDGARSGERLKEEAKEREEKIEEAKGSPQKKGDDRFEDFQDRARNPEE